jgi:23S rRNA (cytosine1962-C5)-methyltransferase
VRWWCAKTLQFAVVPGAGQKTGTCDQRPNRAPLLGLAAGRRVLDAFTYGGGFAVHAAAGGAAHGRGRQLGTGPHVQRATAH